MNPESEGIRDISCSPTAYVGLGAEEAGMAAGGWLSGAGRAHTGRHYHVGSSICGLEAISHFQPTCSMCNRIFSSFR